MSDNRVQMPSSGGGIIRYFDEYKSKIEISPNAVIGIIVAVIIAAIALHIFF